MREGAGDIDYGKNLNVMHAPLPRPEGFFDRTLIFFSIVKQFDNLLPFVLV